MSALEELYVSQNAIDGNKTWFVDVKARNDADWLLGNKSAIFHRSLNFLTRIERAYKATICIMIRSLKGDRDIPSTIYLDAIAVLEQCIDYAKEQILLTEDVAFTVHFERFHEKFKKFS